VQCIDADTMDELHETYSKQMRLLATRGDAMFVALLCFTASELVVLSSLIDDAIWNGKIAAYQSCPLTFADLV
jgi:predicted small integral membrane protein